MYDVRLPIFQGPLDLLLHLIEKRELEITKVSLLEVTEQYVERLQSMENLSLDAISDFLVVAAKLMLIKSLSLLPRPRLEEDEEEDPGEELARQLIEYKRFKEAAEQVRSIYDSGQRSYQRLVPPDRPHVSPGPIEVGPEDLLRAMKRALKRVSELPTAAVASRLYTIDEKMTLIQAVLQRDETVTFSRLVELCEVRQEIIVTFLALLELIKSMRVSVWQAELFGGIMVTHYRPTQSSSRGAGAV